MSLSGEREEGGTASKMSLSGEHDMDTKAKSPIQERPASPVPSCVSMKSDRSMDAPIMFSDGGGPSNEEGMRQQRPASPVPSCVSMKSDRSMDLPITFSDGGRPSNEEGVDHGGECRIKPGPRRYACELTLDPNTACRLLSLSEENRKVTRRRKEQPYPDHPERFEDYPQVLCREGLSGCCYWEAEWSGRGVYIAVTYKGISRRGGGVDCVLGLNNKSWSLRCDDNSYSAWHNNKSTAILAPPSSSHRVGVYLDWPAGTLSFYTVSSDTLTHLHTFHSTFTEPLYPGFSVHYYDSSVSLCQVE
ncbi:stonustoxin subunit beta-like [Osmerus eperlanus]|uniref:stonustoxin subunit beta-like n=1 Tax=Osmerus eperlanus TaxID=29151 RepID=UPI002E0D885B